MFNATFNDCVSVLLKMSDVALGDALATLIEIQNFYDTPIVPTLPSPVITHGVGYIANVRKRPDLVIEE